MKERLKQMLSPERYEHSLEVCKAAVRLAKIYGENEEKAYLAGLLHDCAKVTPKAELIKRCGELGIVLDPIEARCLPVVHAPLGAETVKREFGVTDPDIYNAIRYHTIARAGMSRLEKIIYLADMVEPGRKFAGIDEIRRTAEEDLNKAMILSLKKSMEFNLKKQVLIHPNTLDAWNDLIETTR